MDAIEEFIATCPLAFTLATVVAVFAFLQKTGRDLQAMKLGEKFLIFLGSNARTDKRRPVYPVLPSNQ